MSPPSFTLYEIEHYIQLRDRPLSGFYRRSVVLNENPSMLTIKLTLFLLKCASPYSISGSPKLCVTNKS